LFAVKSAMADFTVSQGASDKTLVEFKLAKNTQLERNLPARTVSPRFESPILGSFLRNPKPRVLLKV
jgi:hypothetical protein